MEHGNIRLRPMESDDFDKIADFIRPLDAVLLSDVEIAALKNPMEGANAATLLHGDTPVCIAMVWPLREGVAEIACITTAGVEEHARDFCIVSQQFVDSVMEGLVRLQCFVLAEHTVSRKWVERLGFVAEGTAKYYAAGGRDCIIYARYGVN